MRKWIVLIWLVILFAAISFLFWYNELQYTLPTPVPVSYHKVDPGSRVDIIASTGLPRNKPLLLHFFNPGCPCSRFNIPHFQSLVKQYGTEITFAVVVMTDDDYTASDIRKKLGVDIPVLFNRAIADSCGVYSTPQAVVLDADHKLYYRGNYNKTRYCTDQKSNYAQIAIESLLQGSIKPLFGESALKSYGCRLPDCKK